MQDCVTVVSGGDDQAIRVAVFRSGAVEPPTAMGGLSMQLTLLSNCQVISAHTSAIRVRKTHVKKAQGAEPQKQAPPTQHLSPCEECMNVKSPSMFQVSLMALESRFSGGIPLQPQLDYFQLESEKHPSCQICMQT